MTRILEHPVYLKKAREILYVSFRLFLTLNGVCLAKPAWNVNVDVPTTWFVACVLLYKQLGNKHDHNVRKEQWRTSVHFGTWCCVQFAAYCHFPFTLRNKSRGPCVARCGWHVCFAKCKFYSAFGGTCSNYSMVTTALVRNGLEKHTSKRPEHAHRVNIQFVYSTCILHPHKWSLDLVRDSDLSLIPWAVA